MKRSVILIALLSLISCFAAAQPASERLSETSMTRLWADDGNPPGIPAKWNYEQGVVLKGIEQMWYATGDPKYYRAIKDGMDFWLTADGQHKDYDIKEYNIDHVTPATAFLTLFRVTNDAKYRNALQPFREQLRTHPRTKEGGFWHKQIYPWQMWLDGLYMGEPFYAEYSEVFGEDNWNDIANQFVWMEKHARDPKTGLLYHGWDESKTQQWADKTTGRSPHVWGRAMGWYAMALVDVLEFFPKDHPRRAELVAILDREAAAIAKYQDKKSGSWWDIMDLPGKEKNYLESSASAMFIYALARGVREGYLPEKYIKTAEKGWAGMQKEFIKTNAAGQTDLEKTVAVSGLGGKPYRDGSYEYYMSEKVRSNDGKGLGPAIRAALIMEQYSRGWPGMGKTVMLDDFYNHEIRKNKFTGADEAWHYKWDERTDAGFYAWGEIFRSYGAHLDTLSAAPTADGLKNASIYIIVDPDTDKETAHPNYMNEKDGAVIADWVKKGGVLVLMGNDYQNAELDHFNILAGKFGVQFNKDRKFEVINNDYKMGGLAIPAGNAVFPNEKKVYVKEVATLKLSGDAKPLITANGDVIMATSRYGKGSVFVIGDPWLYNEYVDGRRLPLEFENFKAAQDLSRWLIAQSRKK